MGYFVYLKAKTNVKLLRDSIAQFQKAIFLKSDFKEVLFNLASIYYNLGEYEKALEYFKKLIQLEPDNEVIKIYFNCSLKKLNKLPQKDQIPEKCPNYVPLIKELEEDLEYEYQYKHDKTFSLEKINQTAMEYIRSGFLSEGIKRFQNGLKIWSESREINYNLGLIYFSL